MKKKIIIFMSLALIVSSILIVVKGMPYKGKMVNKVEKGCIYTIATTGEELRSGVMFPDEPSDGDTYKTKDYLYVYHKDYEFPKFDYSIYICDDCYFVHKDIYEKLEKQTVSGWHQYVLDNNKKTYEKLAGNIAGEPVVSISFFMCSVMKKSPKIPNSVVSLCSTYENCLNLKSMPKIPENVVYMDASFKNCTSLRNVNDIPDSVISMNETFKNCYNLKKTPMLSKNVISLKETFAYCTKLKKMPQIPEGVTHMCGAFSYCENLKKTAKLPDSVIYMGETFKACNSLKKVKNLPENVEVLNGVFAYCTSLEKVPDMPKKVKYMDDAFNDCVQLKNVNGIPAGVINMKNIFKNCVSLTGNIVIDASPQEYETYSNFMGAFYNVDFEKQKLTLSGSSTKLEELKSTAK